MRRASHSGGRFFDDGISGRPVSPTTHMGSDGVAGETYNVCLVGCN